MGGGLGKINGSRPMRTWDERALIRSDNFIDTADRVWVLKNKSHLVWLVQFLTSCSKVSKPKKLSLF